MKKSALISTTLILVLFLSSSFKFGFERLQTISVAINLFGNSKVNMDSYLVKLGFEQSSQYKSIVEYKKATSLANYTYTTSYNNEKLNVISWNEINVFTNDIVDELLENDFERFSVNPDANIYSYRNLAKNILVTLIIKNYSNQVVVTMGPLNSKLPIKGVVTQKRTSIPPVKYFNGTKRFCNNDYWDFVVTINGQLITIGMYPGSKGSENKNKASFIIKGYIKDGKIYTKNPLNNKYAPDLYKYYNNQFMQWNNIDDYDIYNLCK